jgi:hypothetical protein
MDLESVVESDCEMLGVGETVKVTEDEPDAVAVAQLVGVRDVVRVEEGDAVPLNDAEKVCEVALVPEMVSDGDLGTTRERVREGVSSDSETVTVQESERVTDGFSVKEGDPVGDGSVAEADTSLVTVRERVEVKLMESD